MHNLGFVDSKFRLAILAAKRAKQLISGAKQRVDMKAENPLTIALQEIRDGKIDFETIMMSDAELGAEILGGGPEAIVKENMSESEELDSNEEIVEIDADVESEESEEIDADDEADEEVPAADVEPEEEVE